MFTKGYEERFKNANEILKDLILKREQGKKVTNDEFCNVLGKTLGIDPPDPMCMEMMDKMQKSKKEQEDEILAYYKKELDEENQYFTLEALKIVIIVSKNTSKGELDKEIEKQIRWVGLLESVKKEKEEKVEKK